MPNGNLLQVNQANISLAIPDKDNNYSISQNKGETSPVKRVAKQLSSNKSPAKR